jgi:hypothetical protein
MIHRLIDWWRGYSEENMKNVKERISYSKSGGIYVNEPERRALRHLNAMRKAESRRELQGSAAKDPGSFGRAEP